MAVYGFTVNVDGDAQAVMAKINASLHSMGATATLESQKVKNSFSGITNALGGLKNMLLGGLGIGAMFEGVELVKESVNEFNNLANANAKVNAALASTHEISGKTFEGLTESAEELSKKVLFDQAAIKDGQSMLLTFTAIKGKIYDEAIPAIADFATRFKEDLPEAANQIGKALNDPAIGMTRLQKQGVVFSESQKEVIKNFVATGQVAKAQAVILKELNTEFGGLSEAMAKTPQGQAAMFYKEWESLRLKIGGFVMDVKSKMIPVMLSLMESMKPVASAIFEPIQRQIARITADTSGWNDYLAISKQTFANIFPIATDIENKVFTMVGDMVEFVRQSTLLKDMFEGLGEIVQAFMEFGDELVDTFNELIEPLVDILNYAEKINKLLFHSDESSELGDLNEMKKGLGLQGLDITGGKQGGSTLGKEKDNAIKQNALNTSELAGAKGGLGESKIINIKIDTMQRIEKVSGINDIKNAGEDAIDVMIRAINNLAYSQSSTM